MMAASKEYRVVIVGVSYFERVDGIHPTTLEAAKIPVYRTAVFGDVIELDSREAARLEGLGAVVPAGQEASYQEQTVEELQAEADRRGLTVTGSGANDGVLKSDLVSALEQYDVGQAGAITQPGP